MLKMTADAEGFREELERLRESDELYRRTLELSQQLVWTAEPRGRAQMEPAFFELTGLSPGEPARNAIHPDDRQQVLDSWHAAVESGEPHLTEYRLRMRDGCYRHFHTRAAALRDEQGQVVRWYGTIKDIEDQKQAELARAETEERYRLAALATSDVIWDLDVDADTIDWLDTESSFFGYQGTIGNRTTIGWWEDKVHPDDRDRVVKSLRRAFAGSDTHWGERYGFRCADGSYASVYDRGYIIRDAAGKSVRAVGAISDFTERDRAGAEMQRMQAELIHVSRLSAMGAMASTLAHELNQPLTAVASYVRGGLRCLAQGEGSPSHEVVSALEAAEAGALQAGQIVRSLRELVSRNNVVVKATDLAKIVSQAGLLAFIDEQAHRVTHTVELDPAARWVRADGIQIQQVLINLVRNSMQAMEGRSLRRVTITSRAAADHMVEVSVSDTGPGLSPGMEQALFSPFFSRKPGGMGIGLSISRTIVEAHGGRIWAEDSPEGAIFRFTLPAGEEPPKKETTSSASAQP
ncbi:MAG: Two-component oxygen-sensor histidine kinase FixL [uncultured Sphingosinicella sp.]|uniref:histidine kinase n=1 Tax=uncultured Sphingosinicella sp. TaxID=478748 RepID=A0A6J4U5W9_9SPHN|nr:PAS domain-containing protein [uncultured Sphingosinicella sp.]CAA9541515.1 MAG: Two-component oxygen-sensor histidine kinase FixL [uncultured Sphingosinicella sp.]